MTSFPGILIFSANLSDKLIFRITENNLARFYKIAAEILRPGLES